MNNASFIILCGLTRTLIMILSYRASWYESSWSTGFQAATVHPNMNLEQLRQDYFLLLNDSKIKCVRVEKKSLLMEDMNCASTMTKTPPLFMTLFHPFWFITNSLRLHPDSIDLLQNISMGLFMILIDSMIAWLLLKIGELVTSPLSQDMVEESRIEETMDPRISPPYARFLCLTLDSTSITTEPTGVTQETCLDNDLRKNKNMQNPPISCSSTSASTPSIQTDMNNTDSSFMNECVDNRSRGRTDGTELLVEPCHRMEEKDYKTMMQQYNFQLRLLPTLSCRFYCCNPIIILTSLFSIPLHGSNNISIQSVLYLLILLSMHSCMNEGSVLLISVCMAFVISINPSLIFTFIPMLLFYKTKKLGPAPLRILTPIVCSSAMFYICLSTLFRLWYRNQHHQRNITHARHPNMGLLWYFYIQIFPSIRPFYQYLHTGVPFLSILPLYLRLKSYPLELFTAMYTTYTLLKSDPTLYDYIFGLGLMVLCPRSWIRMSRLSLIALAALPVTILLFIITYGLWVESATGNANYIYFQCLAFNLLYSVIVLDFIGATVRRDKALRVTKKARLKLEK